MWLLIPALVVFLLLGANLFNESRKAHHSEWGGTVYEELGDGAYRLLGALRFEPGKAPSHVVLSSLLAWLWGASLTFAGAPGALLLKHPIAFGIAPLAFGLGLLTMKWAGDVTARRHHNQHTGLAVGQVGAVLYTLAAIFAAGPTSPSTMEIQILLGLSLSGLGVSALLYRAHRYAFGHRFAPTRELQ